MIPKSLSATSIAGFEGCAARWYAEWFLRAPSPDNTAAALGSSCHEALDYFLGTVSVHDLAAAITKGVDSEHTMKEYTDYMVSLYSDAYWRLFDDDSRFEEGALLLGVWMKRQTLDIWTPERTILSREVKKNFPIKTSEGVIPFNYICDRIDRIDLLDSDGEPTGKFEIEVIDYKTTAFPLNPKNLRDKPQARCYGVAMAIEYPEAERIWVTFDQLRHEMVGVVFDRDQNVATWRYIKDVAQRIIDTPEKRDKVINAGTPEEETIVVGPPERLNPECRWCIRQNVCETLNEHVEVGGVLSINDPNVAATRIAELEDQMGGLNRLKADLEAFLLGEMERNGDNELDAGEVEVTLGVSSKRGVDGEMVKRILGPERSAKYGAIGVTVVDKILKDPDVTDTEKQQIRGLVRPTFGDPKVKIKRKNPIDAD